MKRPYWIIAALCSSQSLLGAGTVTLTLASSQDGAAVAPGGTVSWTISAAVSEGDNAGLALVVVDLAQAEANPAGIDIPPADSVPNGMAAFSRPDGISNPGEGGRTTGYVGAQRGPPGRKDLVQIGGAQNTLGMAGKSMGLRTAVQAGVGQGKEVVIARGSFPAPSAPGRYVFSLAHPLANTLDAAPAPSGPSPVTRAQVGMTKGEISITVGGGTFFRRGDANADGKLDISDPIAILGFLFLGSPASLPCPASADVNASGSMDVTDAILSLSYLFQGGPAPAEPFAACGTASSPGLDCPSFPPCAGGGGR